MTTPSTPEPDSPPRKTEGSRQTRPTARSTLSIAAPVRATPRDIRRALIKALKLPEPATTRPHELDHLLLAALRRHPCTLLVRQQATNLDTTAREYLRYLLCTAQGRLAVSYVDAGPAPDTAHTQMPDQGRP
jgi:hypothetical protein